MNQAIHLPSGQTQLLFQGDALSLTASSTDSDVFISIQEGGKKTLSVTFENTTCHIFVLNQCSQQLDLQEHYQLLGNSHVTVSFVDVFSQTLTRTVHAEAAQRDAHCILHTAVLARGHQTIDIHAVNHVGHSSMTMENTSVILAGAALEFAASGTIKKGAKQAKNFQKTKALTLGKAEKVKIVPNLYIDENDVEAGHGCTIGDVDENTMYYLNARGLSKAEAMALIVDSFLKTIANRISDPALQSQVKEIIDKQVELYAH